MNNKKENTALAEMEKLVYPAVSTKLSVSLAEKPVKAEDEIQDNSGSSNIIYKQDWRRKNKGKNKTTVVRCIVIDSLNHWHKDAQIDLKGMDTSAFTWGYYGVDYPVLIEESNGLKPFYLPDDAGESSNRLYKAANPDGFKAAFRYHSNLLEKIKIGLMAGIIFGLFGILILLINF